MASAPAPVSRFFLSWEPCLSLRTLLLRGREKLNKQRQGTHREHSNVQGPTIQWGRPKAAALAPRRGKAGKPWTTILSEAMCGQRPMIPGLQKTRQKIFSSRPAWVTKGTYGANLVN